MYQIVTDSCCDIPYSVLEDKNVAFLSMTIELGEEEYIDDLGKTFAYDSFLDKMQKGALPTTSQINVGRYLEFFKPYVEQEIPVVYLAFSSAMSGSYQSACQAVQILEEDFGRDPNVRVIDTKGASLGQGLLVLTACQLRDEGKSLDEVIAIIEERKMYVQYWVTVDDLDQLQRGGRISKTAAALGGLANIKPIIDIDAKGALQNVGKVRGRNKALQTIVTRTVEGILEPADQILLIAYAGDLAGAEKVKALLNEKIKVKDIRLAPLGPTIASHTGYGCIAIFSFGQKRG